MSSHAYALGHSTSELKRLDFQSQLLEPITRRMLSAAGMAPGMRVLDIGCGTGGVTLLAAEMVGPEGKVVGIDRSEQAIEAAIASSRNARMSNIDLRIGALEEFEDEAGFDFIVGRYVLIHQPDPIAFLKKAASLARAKARIAFHELDLTRSPQCSPTIGWWDLLVNELHARAARTHMQRALGQNLIGLFVAAGLPTPDMSYEIPVGGGDHSPAPLWLTETLRTVTPDRTQTTFSDGTVVNIDWLYAELQQAISATHAQVECPGQPCAWVRL